MVTTTDHHFSLINLSKAPTLIVGGVKASLEVKKATARLPKRKQSVCRAATCEQHDYTHIASNAAVTQSTSIEA
jgi:hypothetical protein